MVMSLDFWAKFVIIKGSYIKSVFCFVLKRGQVMRYFVLNLMLVLVFLSSQTFGMGKSDGTKKELKSSIDKSKSVSAPAQEKPAETAPAKPEKKAAEPKVESVKPVEAKAEVNKAVEKAPAVKVAEKPAVPAVDKLIVTVNGVKIMQSQIDERIKPQVDRYASRGSKPTEAMLSSLRTREVNNMIREKLVEEQIKQAGVKVADAQVQTKVDEIAKSRNQTAEQFFSELAKQGLAEDMIRVQIKKGIGFEKVMKKEDKDGELKVADEDAKKFYDENPQHFKTPEMVKASHILIRTENLDEAGKAEARKKIDDLLVRVKAKEDFVELAVAHSEDPTAKTKKGDVGFFPKQAMPGRRAMVEEFSNAAFALQPGQISDVVETKFGYHIIKVTDRKPAEEKSFEEEKDGILQYLKVQKQKVFSKKILDKLMSEAKIAWAEGQEPKPRRPVMPMPQIRPGSDVKKPEAGKATKKPAEAKPVTQTEKATKEVPVKKVTEE